MKLCTKHHGFLIKKVVAISIYSEYDLKIYIPFWDMYAVMTAGFASLHPPCVKMVEI